MKTELDSPPLENRFATAPRRDLPATAPAPRPRAPRRWFKWLLVAIVVVGIGYAVAIRPFLHRSATPSSASRRGAMGAGPVPVTAQPAQQADLNVRLVALGTVTPMNTATVRSRVDGELQKIYFTEGTTVEAGAPLADIDPRPFEAQKAQAEAQLAKDNALLENARVDLNRFKTLLAQDSVASQQVDTQSALVRQYEAATKVDQAQIDTAALQLTYAHITAPISGRIGLRLVDTGNIVHASDTTGLAVITQLRPISVIFSVPQANVPKIMQRLNAGDAPVVEAYDRDGHTRVATGKLVTVDNEIDPTTGTIKLRAEFPNDDSALFPNQFVNVQLLIDQLKGATVVPTAALQTGSVGTYVYTVTPQKTATVRTVETGPSENGVVAITKGLAPGENVVVDGLDRLREGSAVELISHDTTSTASHSTPTKDPSRRRRAGP